MAIPIPNPNPKPSCPMGTHPADQYQPLPAPKSNACLRDDVGNVKDPVRKQLKDALGNQLKLNPVDPTTGKGDYYSYVRVVPKAVVDNPSTNCSCMCGCS
jgi:hypothetical protein